MSTINYIPLLKTDDEILGYTNSTNKKKCLNNARLDIERDTRRMCSTIINKSLKLPLFSLI